MKLHVGCGPLLKEGYRGLDIAQYGRKDILRWNLERVPYPFKDGSVESILAENILEHLSKEKLPAVMQEFYRILKHGGELRIHCPHFSSPAYFYIQHTGAFGTVEEAKFWTTRSPVYSHYNMRFKVRDQWIIFVRKLPWNWIIEPLVNISLLTQKLYENSFVRGIFPACALRIRFRK